MPYVQSDEMTQTHRHLPSSATRTIGYEAVFPPFTLRTSPVMKLDLGEATNRIASAISSGVPARLSGTAARKAALRSALTVSRMSIGGLDRAGCDRINAHAERCGL